MRKKTEIKTRRNPEKAGKPERAARSLRGSAGARVPRAAGEDAAVSAPPLSSVGKAHGQQDVRGQSGASRPGGGRPVGRRPA